MQTESKFLVRAYALSSPTEARTLYDEWAETYDGELESVHYTSPSLAVKAIDEQLKWNPLPSETKLTILDAGCGTGLVGRLLVPILSSLTYSVELDGLDISPGMLNRASKKGVYSTLKEADLSAPLNLPDNGYDIVVCVGTLTQGHVGPSVINELVRVAKPDSLVVLTIMESIWVTGGYEQVVRQLQTNGRAEILKEEAIGFTKDDNSEGGKLLVLRRF